MRDLSGRSLALFAVALILAGVLVWMHLPSHKTNPATTTTPKQALYGQHATVTIEGAVLQAPLCQTQQISKASCADLTEKVTFVNTDSKRIAGSVTFSGGDFKLTVRLELGVDYHVQAQTLWRGHRYTSQVNDFTIGRPVPVARVLLSY